MREREDGLSLLLCRLFLFFHSTLLPPLLYPPLLSTVSRITAPLLLLHHYYHHDLLLFLLLHLLPLPPRHTTPTSLASSSFLCSNTPRRKQASQALGRQLVRRHAIPADYARAPRPIVVLDITVQRRPRPQIVLSLLQLAFALLAPFHALSSRSRAARSTFLQPTYHATPRHAIRPRRSNLNSPSHHSDKLLFLFLPILAHYCAFASRRCTALPGPPLFPAITAPLTHIAPPAAVAPSGSP